MKKGLILAVLIGFVGATVVLAEDQAAAPAAEKAPAKAAMRCMSMSVKDASATCCACTADCKCKANADDPKKCGCGKDVAKVDLKGKFVCEHCSVIADKAGKCAKCGMDMVEVTAAEAAAPAPAPAPAK